MVVLKKYIDTTFKQFTISGHLVHSLGKKCRRLTRRRMKLHFSVVPAKVFIGNAIISIIIENKIVTLQSTIELLSKIVNATEII